MGTHFSFFCKTAYILYLIKNKYKIYFSYSFWVKKINPLNISYYLLLLFPINPTSIFFFLGFSFFKFLFTLFKYCDLNIKIDVIIIN